MDFNQLSAPSTETPLVEEQDDFVSGNNNKLRQTVFRLVSWAFDSSCFPSELTWLLLALIASNGAADLLRQPAAFWIDPDTSSFVSFFDIPLNWGLWVIGILIVYLILAGMTLSLLNIKLAFALWMGLCVYHLWALTNSFRCGTLNFSFENPNNCSGIYTMALLLAGVFWGIAIIFVAQFGLVSWIPSREKVNDPARGRKKIFRVFSISWIGLMGFAVMLAAQTPKPDWNLIEPVHNPSGRSSASLAYDTHRSVATLFGGITSWSQSRGWGSTNDTWEWDGNDWIELHPVHSPSARYGAGMAFDEKRGVTVLFGGSSQDANYQPVFNGDTWEWNGEDWLKVNPPSAPPARLSPDMFFDPLRETVVIYGGYYVDANTQGSVFLNDAWEWDGKAWRQITFDEPRRSSASTIIYDPLRQLPLLMDGEGLWYWEGSLWVQPDYAAPPGRWGSQMAYNPIKQVIMLAGGSKGEKVFNDTWAYDGETWQQLITNTQFPVRDGHNLFYDQTRDTIILFGGRNGATLYDDMWELLQP